MAIRFWIFFFLSFWLAGWNCGLPVLQGSSLMLLLILDSPFLQRGLFLIHNWTMYCGREVAALFFKISAIFPFLLSRENNVGFLSLMVCFSPLSIFQTLQVYCFLTLVGRRMLIYNLEGVKLWGSASSSDPSIYTEITEATVLTDCVVFATYLPNLSLVKNRKASELEGILERVEPNPPCISRETETKRERKGHNHGHTACGGRLRSRT